MISLLNDLCFGLASLAVLYLLLFSLASLRAGRRFAPARKLHRFIVLIPAYREERVIFESVASVLAQRYPRELFEVGVIADHCSPQGVERLAALPIRLFAVAFEQSSKAKALTHAAQALQEEPFDCVVILDADNTVQSDFLQRLNDAYEGGATAIQAHRQAKNLNTETALLDAVSEEINNAIFRKGHTALGLSSALIGSGMAFDFGWFCRHIPQATSTGEDKELEVMLLRERIFIQYLDYVPVYDEKTTASQAFYRQRRRWLAAQWYSLREALHELPGALASHNLDYCDKLFQWMLPPRVLLVGGIFLLGLLFSLWEGAQTAAEWGTLLGLLLVALLVAIPRRLFGKALLKALLRIPHLALLMALNLFRLREGKEKFLHTEHGTSPAEQTGSGSGSNSDSCSGSAPHLDCDEDSCRPTALHSNSDQTHPL